MIYLWIFSYKFYFLYIISSVQSLSGVQLFATSWTTAHQAFLSITSSRRLLKLMSIESVLPSNHLILCIPFSCLRSFPASVFPSSSFFFFFPFIFIIWRLITLQYYSGFCHTLTWISHGFTCIPHPDPPSHLPLYPHFQMSQLFTSIG